MVDGSSRAARSTASGSGRSWRTYYVPVGGRFKAKLKNLYVYFWRWATWKVWETTPQVAGVNRGVVCFISTAGYLTGPAFTAMRGHLRRHASEGWIIDLTPEGPTHQS